MTEAEAARHLCGTYEVPAQQLVECVDRLWLRETGCGSRQLGLKRVARHGGALEDAPIVLAEERELTPQRGRDGGRDLDTRHRHADGVVGTAVGALRRARQLLEVERVARALLVERLCHGTGHGRAEQLARLVRAQRPELQPRDHSRAACALERSAEALVQLARAQGHGE